MKSGNRKKVQIVIPSVRNGGSEKVAVFLFRNLDRSVFDPRLIVLDRIFNDSVEINGEVIQLHKPSVRRAVFSLTKYFLKNRNSNVTTIGFLDHLNLVLIFFKGLGLLKGALYVRSSTILSEYFRHERKFIHLVLAKMLYRRANLVICQSLYMRRDFETNFSLPRSKSQIIYNPITISTDGLTKSPCEFKCERVIQLLAIGNLRKEKGYDRIIRGFSHLERGKYILDIAGEGPERYKLETLISSLGLCEYVRLLGNVDNPQTLIKKCDVFVFGSYFEGYPNVLIEACCFMRPIIAFDDCKTLFEIVQNGKNGFLVEANNTVEFALAIEAASRTKFSDEAFLTISQRHNPQDFIKSVSKLIVADE